MADDTDSPVPSATFSVSEGWFQQREGSLVELRPPEGDLRLVIVEPGPVSDARSASAAAWEAYRGKETHDFKLLTPLPGRNGWDERAFIEYRTSAAEHLTVFAQTYRKGQAWTVAILEGSASTAERREAPLTAILQSLRPRGHARESFSGRSACRLDPPRVEALLDFVRESAAKLDVPGIGIALIDHGEIVFEGGVGVREMGRPERSMRARASWWRPTPRA